MARLKSPTGGKTIRKTNGNATEEQVAGISTPETAPVNARPPQTSGSETRTEQLAETNPSSELRRLGVVKTETRKRMVVPINLEDEIRRRAYEIYEHRGSAPGSEAEDWLTAEREVRERYQKQQQSA
jgi:hypothetical protein